MKHALAYIAPLLLAALAWTGCGGDGTVSPAASASGSSSSGGAGGASPVSSSSGGSTGGSSTGGSASSSASSSSGTGGVMAMGCLNDVGPGHHVFPCDGGIVYDVEIPAPCTLGGCGLVLDMHGFTMNAASEDLGSNMRALGTQHGYVVVQPTAPGIPSSWDQASHAPLVFTFADVAALALAVDPKRIHAMGFSQGGGMTWRMICAHSDFFASASPLGGLAGCEFTGVNKPTREIPILQVHGRKDNVVSFPGIAVPQRDAALAFWSYDAGVVLEDDGAHKATRYTTASGTIFDFWEHDYQAGSFILGGHCFPGGLDVGINPFQFGCNAMGTFVYGELAMQFFIDHPLP